MRTPCGRASDPLGHTAVLEHRATFPLLGVPIEFRSNHAGVIAAAEQALGGWCGLAPELVRRGMPDVVSIVVHPADAGRAGCAPQPLMHRAHGGCYVASDGVNLLTADRTEGRALAFVTPELLLRKSELRDNVLKLLGLLLASRTDRVPLHAAAVIAGERAILLAGRSTAGKSTLCYACVRSGFKLLAEDAVYVSLSPELGLWGHPDGIHLLPDAVRFFPELTKVPPEVQPNGKYKLAIPTERLEAGATIRHARSAIVCVLQRHAGADTRVEPIPVAEAVAVLSEDREPGFDLLANSEAAARAVASGGCYRIIVGHDLSLATAALRAIQ